MHPMLNIAVKAARRAGSIITRASEDINALTVSNKDFNDFVTEVDLASEKEIIRVLKASYPEHNFYGEETGLSGNGDSVWIIDPLDGTTNFIHNFPQYCVSIAFQYKGDITHAVIYDPNRNHLFTASKGQGAFINDRRLRVSKKAKLQDALLGTGFPFKEFSHLPAYINIFEDLVRKTSGVRRPGAAALDLAYVAAGWFDGFWEIGLKPWDVAAGGLLIKEAGGIVSDFSRKDDWIKSGNIVACNPKIYQSFIEIIEKHIAN
jgi:myo-inositol-1(or 4)-monophosphatase